MDILFDYPALVFALSFPLLWLSAQLGRSIARKRLEMETSAVEDFGVILAAALTLLGLIIGFSFSMAAARYDLRKSYERTEANAISTEYIRADLLPAVEREKVRTLLTSYLDQRVLYYSTSDRHQIRQIDARTAQLQAELWGAVRGPAMAQPTPIAALAVAGMNDVLNSRGYTQAAWLNRMPRSAWVLMVAIAFCCNFLIGYRARNIKRAARLLVVLPFIVSTSFFLISDIDSPRGGVILVHPDNLTSLVDSLRAQ